jgi:hypothetical protein
MKNLLVVFLLFVSCNLFAQKQEIGRINIELRDYDRSEYELHLISTFPENTVTIQKFFDSQSDDTTQRFSDRVIIINKYDYYKSYGRWDALFTLFPRQTGQDRPRNLERNMAIVERMLSEEYSKNIVYDLIFDLDDEEYYWIGGKIRTDENGVRHYSFKASFVFYKEGM